MKAGKTSKGVTFILIALTLSSLCSVIPNSKAENQLQIRMDPQDLTVNPGELFNITINIDNMPTPGMAGVQFAVTWNATAMTCVNMSEVLFHSVTPSSDLANIWSLDHTVGDGSASYAYTWKNLTRALGVGYCPISGSHPVAALTFNATVVSLSRVQFTLINIGDSKLPLPRKLVVYSYPPPTFGGTLTYQIAESTIITGNPPPEIIMVSPGNATYSRSPVSLTFRLSEQASWIGYSLDNQANATITGNTTITAQDGAHTLVVYANDSSGQTGASSKVYFTADSTAPTASFVYTPPFANKIFGTFKWEITFNASASNDPVAPIASYTWDFGDNTTGSGLNVTHLYRQAGTYNITLNVQGATNLTSTSTATITLTVPFEFDITQSYGLLAIVAVALVGAGAIVVYSRKRKKTAPIKKQS